MVKQVNWDNITFNQKKLDAYKRKADAVYKRAQATGVKRIDDIAYYAACQLHEHHNPYYILAYSNMERVPVSIDEFIEDENFLGSGMITVWDSLRDDLRTMNPDIFTGQKHVFEVFDGGATGTGKTSKAMITQAYQLYILTCFKKPQRLWAGISDFTPIIMMFQSVQERITKRVIYEPFREIFLHMRYTQKYCLWDKYKDSTLEFSNGLVVAPALASVNAMVGQAIVGGIMDEVNFMSVVEQSKQVIGARGQGGRYDQAEDTYTTLTRRRKSRFLSLGPNPGAFSIISSVRYLDDFMDRRMKEIRNAHEDPTDKTEDGTKVFRRTQYEVRPAAQYSGEAMRVLVGSTEYGTRILKEEEVAGADYPENADVRNVPIEYKKDFTDDPEGALRDVIGVATDVISPFIAQRHKVIECIVRGTKLNLKPWVNKPDVDLEADGLPQIIEANLPTDRDKPRFVHVDLSINKDRCGIAIIKVMGYVATVNDATGIVENLPYYVLEQGISIQPSVNAEIDIADIRNWVILLKDYYGINIAVVSYDGFQSKESIQMLQKQGIKTDMVSMDRTTEPFEYFKRAIYQDRFACQDHNLLKVELIGLEKNEKQGKIDHPPNGCHCKDTKVACVNGIERTMGQLTEDYAKGIQHLGYAWDRHKQCSVPRFLEKPHITKYVTELVEVEMENGEIFRCTPDHPYLLENGEYIAAELLKVGDELQS